MKTNDTKIWYLETSALNFLLQQMSEKEGSGERVPVNLASTTRFYQITRGRDWRVSPITLLEILSTENELKREQLILFSQYLFSSEILPSPTELLIKWIRQGLPKVEPYRRLVSNSLMAQSWREIHCCKDKTLVLDRKLLMKKMNFYRDFEKQLVCLAHGRECYLGKIFDPLLSFFEKRMRKKLSENEIERYNISLFFVFMFLCIGIDEYDERLIKDFWGKMHEDTARVSYILFHLEKVLFSGPIAIITLMAINQMSNPKNLSRGVLFDCLHAMYITYSDVFITADKHFKDLFISQFPKFPFEYFIRVQYLPDDGVVWQTETTC